MSSFLWVYVTVADRREALRLAETVVAEKLAACANIGGPICSIYRWKGKIERSEEVVIVLKTTAKRWQALRRRIVALHSYETPCVLALPVADGHAAFLRWLASETNTVVRGGPAKKRMKKR